MLETGIATVNRFSSSLFWSNHNDVIDLYAFLE